MPHAQSAFRASDAHASSILLHARRFAAPAAAALLAALATFIAAPAAWAAEDADAVRSVPVAADQPRLLEEMLERYREIEARGGWKSVATDIAIGPGYTYNCDRIIQLEKRMVAEGYLDRVRTTPPPPPPVPEKRWGQKPPPPVKVDPVAGPCAYGPHLVQAVRKFQADRKVLGVGQVGKLTWAELNRPVGEIVDILERDVERWKRRGVRPRGTYIMVNLPYFELVLFEDDVEQLRMDVVVGQPSWPTPLFSDELEYIILNPDWGIPDKIAKLEYLPTARRNPKWLAAQGITMNGGSLRQAPGPRNPLGRIKFVMPNRDNVYLHDTPEKGAFKAAVRALSHGCVRLSRPMDLAHWLLRHDRAWNPRSLDAAIATRQTKRIDLDRHMPVHIVYSQSRVNEEGRLELRPDVYGLNKARPSRREEDSDESAASWP